ncbi:hypothetical protein CFI00_04820 [Nocardioides sp. S5]|uniref:hypothetical protein n=1 Tax=Nocardioides sp. S5 TaxID=2017486 RepID=UPI001A8FE1AA|nr:hypothetical protein [Nocardioides sp. S5]QSR29839.1 hypothetical protein CFI00_04820 [Nocardioides sp. S5]
MVNELRELMREASAIPPQDRTDVAAVLGRGRRRVRVRRMAILAGTSLAAGAIALGSLAWLDPAPADLAAAGVPRPAGPTVRLTDARPAVEGQDYRELAAYTNEDLEADNGQYFDGVTDDGLVLFRDGPRSTQRYPRFALMDPATGEKDWLAEARDIGQSQLWAVELSEQRLVLVSPGEPVQSGDDMAMALTAHVYDRASGTWDTLRWTDLPAIDGPWGARVGPDGRLYVPVLASRGEIPEGGWPTGPDGEADDADAEGDTYDLWSVSLTEQRDVRDEGLRVGAFDFAQDAMVWTDSQNGDAGRVHVRDLATGEERSFDPALGERCNLLGFSADGDRIAMSQYCGTYEGGVRDDRVQVVTTDGDQVMTVQDNGVEGGQLVAGGDYLTVTAYDRATGGTYLYDFDQERLLRLSDGTSSWSVAVGPTPGDQFMWTTPAGGKVELFGRSGATAHLGEIIR